MYTEVCLSKYRSILQRAGLACLWQDILELYLESGYRRLEEQQIVLVVKQGSDFQIEV